MRTKSSQKPAPKRRQNKWRNLPSYGHGITPSMKARPVVYSSPNETLDGVVLDDFFELMPVSMTTFLAEHTAMILVGYSALSTDEWYRPCSGCGCESMAFVSYAKRHRNGKPDYKNSREFLLCPQCLHVGESILVFRTAQTAALALDTDSDAA